jgi:hypothetical protein
MSNRSNTELWASRLIWTAVVTNLPHKGINVSWGTFVETPEDGSGRGAVASYQF